MFFVKFRDKEEIVRSLEFQVEENRAEIMHKVRQIQDLQDTVTDMKNQMAEIRQQKNSCEKEVRLTLLENTLKLVFLE